MKTPIVYVALQQFCETDDTPRRLLLEAGCEVRENPLGRRLRREELSRLLAEAEAVIAGIEPYDTEVLAALPKLQCISRCGIGTDSIDVQEAQRRGIAVYTTPDEVTEPVAQLTVALILALARHLPQHLDAARAGRWEKRTGALLSEWTIGLIGFGRIGRAVERLLRPFSPRILAADPAGLPGDAPETVYPAPSPTNVDRSLEVRTVDARRTVITSSNVSGAGGGVKCAELAALLAQADLVSLHAGRPADAGPLLGRHELALMKRGSYLVNTARGHLVDEAALIDALRSGHLAGAALDVFAEEPYAGPLARLPQVLCTPHVASLTRASRAAMERRCAQHVVEWLSRNLCPDRRS